MIRIDTSYSPTDHTANVLSFHPHYYTPGEGLKGVVLFFHSPVVVDKCEVRCINDVVQIFGDKPPKIVGFFALYDLLLTTTYPVLVVTVPVDTPLPDAMWEFADNLEYEHAKYMQLCLTSVFPRKVNEHE